MRWFASTIALTGYVLFVPSVFATGQRIQPVHPERERMSEVARRKAVVDDLTGLLSGPADPTKIATAPYVADDGLCKRDVISLEYRQTQHRDGRTITKPVRIASLSSQYHYLGEGYEMSGDKVKKACRTLEGVRDYWVNSESDRTARFGLPRLKQVAAAVRAKEPVSLDCKSLNDTWLEARCAAEFLMIADRPAYVGNCSESGDDGKRDCFVYGLGNYDVTIIWDWTSRSAIRPVITVRLESGAIIV